MEQLLTLIDRVADPDPAVASWPHSSRPPPAATDTRGQGRFSTPRTWIGYGSWTITTISSAA